MTIKTIKNRGSLSNPAGRFDVFTHDAFDDGWEQELEQLPPLETFLYPEPAKSIISRNQSPDIGFEQSINPYRGCEHGCIYCYARPSHAYLNLSPGLDFETKIFYKVNADQLLLEALNKPSYQCKPIVIGANTDPYQPAEAKLKITRKLLEVLLVHQHPVIIITKNSLIERDVDILSELAKKSLVKIAISVTTLSKELKLIMEPRTSMPSARLKTIQRLTAHNIPVRAMLAPIIPMVNDSELERILESVSQAGAKHASYVVIRLPHEVKDLFKEWLEKHFPMRAEHIISLIRQMRGGKEYDSTFGKRMRGEGEFANLLEKRFKVACNRYGLNQAPSPHLTIDLFKKLFNKKQDHHQLNLWDDVSFEN